jgi:hypothetical protein
MKMLMQRAVAAATYLGLALAATPASAISYGMVDTFAAGSTNGWHDGGGLTPPAAIPGGGPAGAGDGYLQVTAVGGSGPSSRLAAISGAGWIGDYTAAGVTLITLDAINLGSTVLHLRLYFTSAAGTALSSVAQVLPVASSWTHLVFPVSAGALTGSNTAGTLHGVTEMRVFDNADPIFPPPPIVALLGMDNVSAVPEPSPFWLWAAAGSILVLPATRRRLRQFQA